MSNYTDPENLVESIIKIKNSQTLGDVKQLMDSIFPTLFITVMNSFCDDYEFLNENWRNLCISIPTTRKQVMILDNYPDDCTLIKTFAECFTTAGFVVRRKYEFIPCEKCKKAIPSESIYNFFKEKNFNIPEKWSRYCKSCV